MSGERQGVNPNEFVVLKLPNLDKKEAPAMTIEKLVDEGPDRVTLVGRIMESKPVKKVISWVAATATAVSLVPGSMAAETENTVAPDKEIKIEGEMPSQNDLGGVMAGVLKIENTSNSKEVVFGSEDEKTTDARFKSFLEGEGELSDEKLKNEMFYSYVKGEVDLGFCGINQNGIKHVVQGVLLGQFEYGNKIFVAIGAKNREGEREISLTQWLVEEKVAAYSSAVVVNEVRGNNSISYKNENLYSNNDAISFLENQLGRVVLFYFINGDYKLTSNIDEKIHNYYSEHVVPRRDTNINYLSRLLVNLDSNRFSLNEVKLVGTEKINQVIGVASYSEVIDKLSITSSNNFPLLDSVGYRSVK